MVNGHIHSIADRGGSLLDVLRDDLGLTGAKDGCSPQGQCGCCTVLIDGRPRVACVTPARRVQGREVVTIEGLGAERAAAWGRELCASGGSQCGFCTPGIVLRLEAAAAALENPTVEELEATSDTALLAHLCRCTGWQTITEAFVALHTGVVSSAVDQTPDRQQRIDLESATPQVISPSTTLGSGGFAADSAPSDALVAVRDAGGEWVVGDTLAQARRVAGKVQGRRTTKEHHHPIPVPTGEFVATLQTGWTDPGYLETDASWCSPGGEPASCLGNGGAFGGKAGRDVERAARRLADAHGRPVLALFSREDVIRLGPKRPPVSGGIRADGSGVLRIATTDGADDVLRAYAPEFDIEQVTIAGPPTSVTIRGAVWAEVAVLRSALQPGPEPIVVEGPSGSIARVSGGPHGIDVSVRAGAVGDPVVLRSYCIGAAHAGWSWATSEALTVTPDGEIHDLTVRSLGIGSAADTPPIRVELVDEPGRRPINGSDAVFAAVAALAWRHHGLAPRFPLLSQLPGR